MTFQFNWKMYEFQIKHLKTSERLYDKAINNFEGAEDGVPVVTGEYNIWTTCKPNEHTSVLVWVDLK